MKMKEQNIKAWVIIDSEGLVVEYCRTRKSARNIKKNLYSPICKIAKLKFDRFTR